jgi:hypothetical protein
MKRIILMLSFIFFALFFVNCGGRNIVNADNKDTSFLEKREAKNNDKTISLRDTIKLKEDSIHNYINLIKIYKDSIRYYKDSVKYENYSNSVKILKIKYYIKITKKHPKNKKYFWGWVNRTISE